SGQPPRRGARPRRSALSAPLVHGERHGGVGRDRAHPPPVDRARFRGGGPMSLHAVILAGGSGTRFWPLSRAKKPKQFLPLVTGRTMIAETFLRVEPLCSSARTWVVCGTDHVEAVRKALPGLPPAHLVVEPAARNTAPA